MKNAVLVPGRPDKDEYYNPTLPATSQAHWFPWLQKQLHVNDIFAVTVEMPKPYQPRYEAWKREFERYDITPETVLVGHSCGGGFLVRWLSENKDKVVGKVVLVAPWLNPSDNPASDTADFFHFKIDPQLASRTASITIFNSDNDEESIQISVKMVREQASGLEYKEFHAMGHFCAEDGLTEFPELLEEILA